MITDSSQSLAWFTNAFQSIFDFFFDLWNSFGNHIQLIISIVLLGIFIRWIIIPAFGVGGSRGSDKVKASKDKGKSSESGTENE